MMKKIAPFASLLFGLISQISVAGEKVVEDGVIASIVVNQSYTDKVSVYFKEGQGACIAGAHANKSQMTEDMWNGFQSAIYLAAATQKKVDLFSPDESCENVRMINTKF